MFRAAKLLSAATRLRVHRDRRKTSQRGPAYHRLGHEPLEDRRVLSAVTVTNDLDLVNGDTSSIANLIASDGGDGIALREAIDAANATPGADDIVFDFGHDGPATILLELGELQITDALTITGDGSDLLTIDASGSDPTPTTDNGDGSRSFTLDDNVFDNKFDVQISGLTLTGGDIAGGAIENHENLTLHSSTISGNFGHGAGGAVLNFGMATVTNTIISDNSVTFFGGGISNYGTISVNRSTISGNSAGRGGAISNYGTLSVTQGTISGNTAYGGGGIINYSGATIIASTISGNVASSGGGITNYGTLTVGNSTVTGNDAFDGGGIYNDGSATLNNSVVANNRLGLDIEGNTLTGANNLIEDGSGGLGDTITGDPLLGPLADNGGPTMTHALLPGSPAIDAGDPAFVGPPFTDQRGYYRVVDGDGDMTARIDIGAFEYASVTPLSGDGNLDGTVDGLDYLLWANHYGDDPAVDPPGVPMNGDYNDDGVVNGLDYLVWVGNYGATVPVAPVAVTIEPLAATTSQQLAAVDAAFAGAGDMGGVDTHARSWRHGIAFDAAFDDLLAVKKNPRHRRR